MVQKTDTRQTDLFSASADPLHFVFTKARQDVAPPTLSGRTQIMRRILLSGLVSLLLVSSSLAAGFAHTKNFIVLAPASPDHATGQALAEETLTLAEQYRKQIAEEWFGAEIPLGEGRTTINVSFDPGRERALTWAKDDPRRTLHAVYVRTTQDRGMRGIDEMLPHEIAHIILATQFPHPKRLPPWLEEGIASRYDDADRIEIRRRAVRRWSQTGTWPKLAQLLKPQSISARNIESYAAAASLVDFLITRGEKKTLFEFARDGQRHGWNRSLQKHYHIEIADQLQVQWKNWVNESKQVALHRIPSATNQ